ncbi:hypothetical protein ACFV2Q_18035 [Streptomyces sp. NPDC059650]
MGAERGGPPERVERAGRAEVGEPVREPCHQVVDAVLDAGPQAFVASRG